MQEERYLKLYIYVDEVNVVKSAKGEARMLLFHGNCDTPYFCGEICSGGVDTQIQPDGKPNHLSARYMLKGTDMDGRECKLFIENNGSTNENGEISETIPTIYTDSECLKFLEDIPLCGHLDSEDGTLVISIYGEKR